MKADRRVWPWRWPDFWTPRHCREADIARASRINYVGHGPRCDLPRKREPAKLPPIMVLPKPMPLNRYSMVRPLIHQPLDPLALVGGGDPTEPAPIPDGADLADVMPWDMDPRAWMCPAYARHTWGVESFSMPL